MASWPSHEGPVCPTCGAFRDRPPAAPTCDACPAGTPFDAARSLYPHEGGVRGAILAAKYGGLPAAPLFAALLDEALSGRFASLLPGSGPPPAVVPVPASPLKYLLRGHNLPALTGAALAKRRGWPFRPAVIHRRPWGRPQAGLPLREREGNVRDAFRVPPRAPVPSGVLLVDDVYTSGATAAACARALKGAGTARVVVLTVARAVPGPPRSVTPSG